MRSSESRPSQGFLTLLIFAFAGLVWGAMAFGFLGSQPPAQPRSALAGPAQVYRAVLVTGTIQPAERGLLGAVKAVEIVVPQVGSFRVDDSGKGRDLKDHVGETVTVMAMSRADSGGNPILRVEDYAIDPS